MEMEASDSVPLISYNPARAAKKRRGRTGERLDGVHVKRETLQLQALLEQCQRALESLKSTDGSDDPHDDGDGLSFHGSSGGDAQVAELCDLLKSRVESPSFLEKLGSTHLPVSPKVAEAEDCSWDVIDKSDLWEDFHDDGDNESDKDGYVLVKQEDAMEGIACFMAAYLLSLKETKDLTPNQLQEALSKTLSVKKKKGKLKKAWDGSIVIYNVASWSATAIGIYQNPTLLRAASEVFWTSCRLISKLM